MGEVYRAKDSRLDRTVAIKVLPEHLSKNPELEERFAREAKAISSLNHPHICTLYDIGHEDGVSFMVMELIEGETLADRQSGKSRAMEAGNRSGIVKAASSSTAARREWSPSRSRRSRRSPLSNHTFCSKIATETPGSPVRRYILFPQTAGVSS